MYIFLISVFLIIILISSVIIFKIFYTDLSPTELEECVTLKQNNDGRINIVFFADKKDDVQSYIDYLIDISPLNGYKEKFNFYYIGDYRPVCEIYKNIALLCYSRELIKKAGSCPNDYIVVLSNDKSDIIRSSSYMNVMSINAKHPKSVLTHEFGHAFVNLAEEYVPAKIPRNSAGNCVQECKDFEGKNDGCYIGCSLSYYTRSIENGIMRTLKSDNFGSFNEHAIIKRIEEINKRESFGITGRVTEGIADCTLEQYYLFDGLYDNGKFTILKKSIELGCFGETGYGGFIFELELQDDTKIKGNTFNPELIFTDKPGEIEINGESFISDKEFYLKVPFAKNAKKLIIRDINGNQIISTSLCESLKGDANGDEKIDFTDIEHIIKYLSKDEQLHCLFNADFNEDNILNFEDINGISDLLAEMQLSGANQKESSVLPISNTSNADNTSTNIIEGNNTQHIEENQSSNEQNQNNNTNTPQNNNQTNNLQIENKTVIIPSDNLILYYSFDTNQNSSAIDQSGNGNNGIAVGNASWTANGYLTGGFAFDGTGDKIDVADNWQHFRNNFSISAWINPVDDNDAFGHIVSTVEGGGGSAVQLFASPQYNFLRCIVGRGSGDRVELSPWNDVGWHHYVCQRRDTGVIELYRDGVLVASKTGATSGNLDISTNNFLRVGGIQDNNLSFNGFIDEVFIFDRTLNNNEIIDIADSKF